MAAVKALHPAQATLQREINPVIYGPAEFARRVRNNDPFVRGIIDKEELFITGTADDLGKLAGDPQAATL